TGNLWIILTDAQNFIGEGTATGLSVNRDLLDGARRFQVGQQHPERFHIANGETVWRQSASFRVLLAPQFNGLNANGIRSQQGKLSLQFIARPCTDRSGSNHGRDAKDHTEHGENTSHFVESYFTDSNFYGFPKVHSAFLSEVKENFPLGNAGLVPFCRFFEA